MDLLGMEYRCMDLIELAQDKAVGGHFRMR